MTQNYPDLLKLKKSNINEEVVDPLMIFKTLLTPIFKRNNVLKAVVFGSTARATRSKKSDLDLMIVMKSDKRFFDRYDDFHDIYDAIKGQSVDMLIYTPEELDRISGRNFIQKILSEGKTIYEQ